MPDLTLSCKAASDLADIARFTTERFGPAQARSCREALLGAMQTIGAHPDIGSDQSHIAPGVRGLVHGAHAIYYRRKSDGVFVLHILGPGQDPTRSRF
ncbi:MAG: type II toxin-antitoxin system RelE/ParE family toxin [Alphaproteobacteria bacterium]